MINDREEEFYGMKKERVEYLQCCYCGNIHKQKIWCNDNDLYIENIKCEKCKKAFKHLRCGESLEYIYMHYDCTMDFRYYNYNDTKQND